jgi:hypothetical protein
LRQVDLDAAEKALAAAGFVRRHAAGIDMFLDGPEARLRDALYVVIAREKIRAEYSTPAPDVSEAVRLEHP